jgi:hypothetical protein
VNPREYGYINVNGEFVIEPRPLLTAGDFHEGLAAIRGAEVRGQIYYKGSGYMDKTGKVIVPEEFGSTSDFSEGLAAVRASSNADVRQWGYIDKSGKWVVEPRFDYALPFRGGLAVVAQDKKLGYIDRTGRFIWPLKE